MTDHDDTAGPPILPRPIPPGPRPRWIATPDPTPREHLRDLALLSHPNCRCVLIPLPVPRRPSYLLRLVAFALWTAPRLAGALGWLFLAGLAVVAVTGLLTTPDDIDGTIREVIAWIGR